jgi:hypothetical protein
MALAPAWAEVAPSLSWWHFPLGTGSSSVESFVVGTQRREGDRMATVVSRKQNFMPPPASPSTPLPLSRG